MITPDEALRIILENVKALPEEEAPLSKANDRVLAQDLVARENLPSFDNSAMDGFAVRSEDLTGAGKASPVGLPVQDIFIAGTTKESGLRSRHAIKIMTGAPVPVGADAIAIKETTRADSDAFVEINHQPDPGDHIRRAGEDVRSGDLLLKKGVTLRPYEIALLAAQGLVTLPVIRQPRIKIFATGDELVDPSQDISFGKIRNSNGPSIVAGLNRWGVEPTDSILVRDNADELEGALRIGLMKNDVLIISGGVSIGDYDHTKAVLEKIGFQILFWKVAIKPGKPLLFAKFMQAGQPKYAFGLPGNPVSALVCLEEFVRVALETLKGHKPHYPSYHLKGHVLNSYVKPVNRQQYIFCQVQRENDEFLLSIIRPQGSAMMGMASRANSLAVAPIGVSHIQTGDVLSFRWLK